MWMAMPSASDRASFTGTSIGSAAGGSAATTPIGLPFSVTLIGFPPSLADALARALAMSGSTEISRETAPSSPGTALASMILDAEIATSADGLYGVEKIDLRNDAQGTLTGKWDAAWYKITATYFRPAWPTPAR